MGKKELEKLNEYIKNGKDINNIIEGMNEYFEKCENIGDAIPILQKINDLFLTTYELKITDKNKEKAITISPVETEIYFSNKQCRDGMIHENERQKEHFGQIYFHRIKGWGKKGTDPIDIKSGGLDVCISKSRNCYLSILIRSAYIKKVDMSDKKLVSGITKIPNELINYMRIKEDECIECLLKGIEKDKSNENVVVERDEKIRIENIFHQPRISSKDYSPKDYSKNEEKYKFLLNSLNKGKDNEILNHIILDFDQGFYKKFKEKKNKEYKINGEKFKEYFEKEKQTLY